jgi:hypothetical protein
VNKTAIKMLDKIPNPTANPTPAARHARRPYRNSTSSTNGHTK